MQTPCLPFWIEGLLPLGTLTLCAYTVAVNDWLERLFDAPVMDPVPESAGFSLQVDRQRRAHAHGSRPGRLEGVPAAALLQPSLRNRWLAQMGGDAAVYVITGNAKFRVPSPQELFARATTGARSARSPHTVSIALGTYRHSPHARESADNNEVYVVTSNTAVRHRLRNLAQADDQCVRGTLSTRIHQEGSGQ